MTHAYGVTEAHSFNFGEESRFNSCTREYPCKQVPLLTSNCLRVARLSFFARGR